MRRSYGGEDGELCGAGEGGGCEGGGGESEGGSRSMDGYSTIRFRTCLPRSMLPRLGDLIRSRGEDGVVCYIEPPIMRTHPFVSYVIFDRDEWALVQAQVDPGVSVKPELVERVRRYIAAQGLARHAPHPTGGDDAHNPSDDDRD